MKGRLVIEYSDTSKRIDYLFEESLGYDKDIDYLLWITLPRGREVDTSKIKLGLHKYLLRKLNGKQYAIDFPERLEILKEAYSKDLDLFDSCTKIEIKKREDEDISQLSAITTSDIIIDDGEHPLCLEEVKRLEKLYSSQGNIYVYVEGNEKPVSLKDYRATVESIQKVADRIKSYGLSPLETAIYAYDYARDRIYIAEDKDEEHTESRDLTKALLGDKIVCVGYARIFSAILRQLGINASPYSVQGKEVGHAIAIARLTDEKYGIDGIYYFDPTRERKMDESDEHYYKYGVCAVPRGTVLGYGYYSDETFGPIDIDEYKKYVKAIQARQQQSLRLDYYKYVCNMIDFLDSKSIYTADKSYSHYQPGKIESTEDIQERLDVCYALLCQEISPRKKIEAISKVRRIEYYENSKKYPMSAATMRRIADEADLCGYYYSRRAVQEVLEEHHQEYERVPKEIDLVKVLTKVRDKKLSEDK